jgi:hypothetical protein
MSGVTSLDQNERRIRDGSAIAQVTLGAPF